MSRTRRRIERTAIESPDAIRPCVLYARVSSREQEEEGFSVPSQLRLLHGYCQSHRLDPLKEFVDIESAKNPGARNAFEEMLTFLRRNRTVTVAVCEKTDRFYRNFRDYVSVDELQVSLHFPKENVVLSHGSSSHEKFMHGIKVLMAKNYIDNLSEEVRKGMLEKCEQGGWPAQAPLGYTNIREDKKSRVVIDPERGPLIRKLFETYARGGHSVKTLGKLARAWGLTFRKSGVPVSPATVHNILRNRFYCGDFVWGGRTYRGSHDALVSRDLWQRVQDVLDGRNAVHPKRRKHDFLFAGLIRCGLCGCAMVTERHKGRYNYLRCSFHRGKCASGYTRQEVIEEHVATLLDGLIFPADALAYLTKALRDTDADDQRFHEESIARLEAEYGTLQKRLDAMYLDKLDGRITNAFFDRMAAEMRGEQDR
ncbi:MAG: recombinase family protein, partial [Thermoplasmata archaeon]